MTSKYSTRYGDSEYVSTPEKNGCYLSKTTFCIICVVFIALLVGVALIFYFGPEETPSDCDVAVCVAPFPAVPGEPVEEEEPSFTGRLPESLKPYHYNLVVRVFLDEEDGDAQFTFDGNVTISITCVETTNVITLHAFDIEVDPLETLITDMQGTEIGISSQTIDELHEFYIIELKTSLKAGEEYSAYLTFEGILGRELHGLYRSSYNDPETKWLVASQFQATGARKMFPCFDEPNMKATFDMVIVHRDTRNALWNMPLVKTVPTYDNWLESHFETSVIMPTYLLAVVVSDFPYLEIVREDGLVFRVWSQPDLINAANYSLYAGNAILGYMEHLYQISYPLTKMDMVAIPQFLAGAMENWGLVLYSEVAMIYDEEVNTPSRKEVVATIVSHELGHMWFGNLVTMDWWNHIWLNEGFATFNEYVGADFVEPTWQMWDQFLISAMDSAFTADSRSTTSKPLIREAGWNLLEMFDTITYSKGGSIVRQLASFLSDDVISRGINDYLTIHSYNNVVTDDLWNALTAADLGHRNTNVKMVMDTWTLQAGHPVVTVNRTDADNAVATQRYFMMDPHDFYDAKYDHMGYTWYVPLTLTHGGNPDFVDFSLQWLNANSTANLDLSNVDANDWILVNVNKLAFYRVNYDDENWKRLSEQLKDNHEVINPSSRASIMDDAFKISQPGHTDHVNALRLTEYMDKEVEYVAWDIVIGNIDFTHNALLRTAEFGLFELYWRTQITPLYETLGWDFLLGDHLDYFQRINAIDTACLYGNDDCVQQSLAQYRSWMETGNNTIRDEVRSTVYCTSIKHGDVEEWEFAYNKAIERFAPVTEANRLRSAMGCTEKAWLLERYLEDDNFAISGTLSDIRDKSSTGYSVAWEFTMENFDKLGLSYNTVWDFQTIMNTDYDLKQLTAFSVNHHDMAEDDARDYYEAVETVEKNIVWMNRNKQSIKEWLLEVTSTMKHSVPTDGERHVPKPDSSGLYIQYDGLIQDGHINGKRVPLTSEAMLQLVHEH